jgi:RNA polymerase sigma-70 factor (ECF subfamily)
MGNLVYYEWHGPRHIRDELAWEWVRVGRSMEEWEKNRCAIGAVWHFILPVTNENDEWSEMDGQVDYIQLVELAQRGDKPSLERLAGIAGERLRVYAYRLTQDNDLTQEIVQESLLEMCKVLGKLQRADRFWSWLYGIATNKLHRHYRTEKALQHAAASEERRQGSMKERQGGLENLVSQELKQIVSTAMQKLRTRHKAVLIMRCYDGMSYSEIAESMGCSEFSTRMLFMRAKQALQKELSHNGFGKGSLLAALVIFGKITAPSKAAAAQLTVSATAMEVGLLAGVVGVATTKTALLSIAAASAVTVGAVMATSTPGDVGRATTTPRIISPFGAPSSAGQAYWFYFPDEPDGPVMLRATSGTDAGNPNRRVLQNSYGNYSYEGKTVQINNYRMWMNDLSVFTLPTDSSGMRGFLSRMRGREPDIQAVDARGKGLLVVLERNAQGENAQPWSMRYRNVLNEDYFQSDWRSDATMVDNRDAMHKRGWTYFRVRGQINGRDVTGVGRTPFIYAMYKDHGPWLRLRVGNDLSLMDSDAGAYVLDARETVLSKYARGSFFKGLSRPWMGLHTMDMVRRDAAARQVPFQTVVAPDGKAAQVTVVYNRMRLVYTVDLETDVVKNIVFVTDNTVAGRLEFEYLQDLPVTRSEFIAPRTMNYRGSLSQDTGMFWLSRLADGTLAKSTP